MDISAFTGCDDFKIYFIKLSNFDETGMSSIKVQQNHLVTIQFMNISFLNPETFHRQNYIFNLNYPPDIKRTTTYLGSLHQLAHPRFLNLPSHRCQRNLLQSAVIQHC